MFPNWQVGDIITHGWGDLHRVLWTDADGGEFPHEIEVVCIRSSANAKYQKGDKERNVVWTFDLVVRHVEITFTAENRNAA